jgi:hypothetical protein
LKSQIGQILELDDMFEDAVIDFFATSFAITRPAAYRMWMYLAASLLQFRDAESAHVPQARFAR